MLYYENVNDELKKYFLILCDNDYPLFIEKYLDTKKLKRISKVGQFCGCDYTKLHNVKFFYSRLDHSISCALMVWHLTKDKSKTLMALFHDLGTPVFSHTIDYLLGDTEKQNSSERDIFEIVKSSKEITDLLKEDNISLEDLKVAYKCDVVENEKPKLCSDRLDGVLHTAFIWQGFWNLDDIKEVYEHITILKNEEGQDEIGFDDKKACEKFFDASYKYSIVLQGNEDKYTMQYIADALKVLIDENVIKLEDLYTKSEEYVVKLLEHNINSFFEFENASHLERTDERPLNYCVSLKAKRRYVMPLCNYEGINYRLEDISDLCKNKINNYMVYKDSMYSYVPNIKDITLKKENR